MNDDFHKRIRSAAIAGWWTLLIAVSFVTFQWLFFLGIVSAKPDWMLRLWGPDVTWAVIQNVGLWCTAIFKVCLYVAAMIVVWLSLWARRLGRQ